MRAKSLLSIASLGFVGCAAPAALDVNQASIAAAPALAPTTAPIAGATAPTLAPAAEAEDGLFSVRWADNHWKGRLTEPVTAPYWFESPMIHTSLRPVLIRHNFPSDSIFGAGELDVIALQARLAVTERLDKVGTWVGIPLLDHLVVGEAGYWSFAKSAHCAW